MTNKSILPLLLLSLVVFSLDAFSDVLVEDTRINGIGSDNLPGFTTGTIETGTGEEGDYVILVCAIGDDRDDITANQLSWTQLDKGICGGNSPVCGRVILGSFVDSPNSQDIECSWSVEVVTFVSGSIRYSGVDRTNPIIDVACNSGQGALATAPSIQTEAGSQVLRVVTDGISENNNNSNDNTTRAEPTGSFATVAVSMEFQRFLETVGQSSLFMNNGPTGEEQYFLGDSETTWRACTIGIRMIRSTRNVPTMSEWGLIAMAGVLGLAGLLVVRRRKAAA